MRTRPSVHARFLSKIKVEPSGCWLWTGGRFEDGYGTFNLTHRKLLRAHRAAWLLFRGAIPSDVLVCHACDVPLCVNPEHLWLGTHQENQRDKFLKGRSLFGERNAAAKLTWEQVFTIRQLRQDGMKVPQLAEKFNMGETAIWDIVSRNTWNEDHRRDAMAGR